MNPPDNTPVSADPKIPPAETRDTVYLYETAGLRERHGHIPLWLWAVVVALSVWGVYYLITYWQPPAS